MGFFRRFPIPAAIGCGVSYAMGTYWNWVLTLSTGGFSVLMFGICVFLWKRIKQKEWAKAYRATLWGLGVGVWIGFLSVGRVNLAAISGYGGMDPQKVRVIEGEVLTDSVRRGGDYLVTLGVYKMTDQKGNHHSARWVSPVLVKGKVAFYRGDRIRVEGAYVEEQGRAFLCKGYVKAVLLERSWGGRVREWLLKDILHREGKEFALLEALLFGIRDGLDDRMAKAFRQSGTSHILALSGMHVGIIVLILEKLLTPFMALPLRRVFIALLLGAYPLLVGPFPSLIRAVIMYALYAGMATLDRRIDPLDLLANTFLLSCLLLPESVFSYSNILSFAAVLGILALHKGFHRFLRRFVFEPLSMALSVSWGAQVATGPLSLWFFGQLPLFGWLATIVISPLITLFVWVGLISILLEPLRGVLPPLVSLQPALRFLYTAIGQVAEWFANAPALRIP